MNALLASPSPPTQPPTPLHLENFSPCCILWGAGDTSRAKTNTLRGQCGMQTLHVQCFSCSCCIFLFYCCLNGWGTIHKQHNTHLNACPPHWWAHSPAQSVRSVPSGWRCRRPNAALDARPDSSPSESDLQVGYANSISATESLIVKLAFANSIR